MPSSTTAARCAAVQAHHGQRHADLVVQVALRGQARFLAKGGGQDGRDHFLDRGLAVAAGDADDGNGELAAPCIADPAQRHQRVRHDDGRQREALRQLLDDDRRDAVGGHLLEEVVGIEGFAAQCDEQRARGLPCGCRSRRLSKLASRSGVRRRSKRQLCERTAHVS
jgi:hypothetical protein